MDPKKPETTPTPTAKAMDNANVMRTQSRRDLADILGSYTGTSADGDAPEQDVDDL